MDCFFNPSGDSDFSSVADAHRALVDQVVEVDEALMSLYLEQGEIEPDQLHAAVRGRAARRPPRARALRPARTGAGVAELMDVLVKLAPNPTEGNPPLFYKGEGGLRDRVPLGARSRRATCSAHVFKVVVDPVRRQDGRVPRPPGHGLTRDTQLFVGDGRKAFKVGHLFMLEGAKYVETRQRSRRPRRGRQGRGDRVRPRAHDSHDEDHTPRPLEFPGADARLRDRAQARDGPKQRIPTCSTR